MKNMIRFAVMVVMTICLFGSSLVTFGQSSMPPVWSQDVLREFALGNVVRGSRSVYAESMNWSFEGSKIWVDASGVGTEEVLEKLFIEPLLYQMANENDLIRGYVYLYDKHDRLLFYGYAEYTLASLKRVKPTYNIWMQYIPVLENVASAEVLALDEDGKTARRTSLDVDEYGRVLFEAYLAGSVNGLLSVRFKDGTLATYFLGSSLIGRPGVNNDAHSGYKIDGHYVFDDPATIKIIETWQKPTIFLRIPPDDMKPITFDVLGLVQENGLTEFERPTSMTVTRDVPGFIPQTFELDRAKPTTVKWPIGTYRIHFGWERFGRGGHLYTGPDYDGGEVTAVKGG